ncbi:MAG: hypothetical protein ACFFB3_21615 [Candidatus Hodarchaeota archaeon]
MSFLRKLFRKKETDKPTGRGDATVEGRGDATVEGSEEPEEES